MVEIKTTAEIYEDDYNLLNKTNGKKSLANKRWVSLDELKDKISDMMFKANDDFADNDWTYEYFKAYHQALGDVFDFFSSPETLMNVGDEKRKLTHKEGRADCQVKTGEATHKNLCPSALPKKLNGKVR